MQADKCLFFFFHSEEKRERGLKKLMKRHCDRSDGKKVVNGSASWCIINSFWPLGEHSEYCTKRGNLLNGTLMARKS